MLIEWRPEFATGHHDVDREHRALIDLINEQDAGAAAVGGAGGTGAEALVGDLYARIGAHFALEERVMREQGWHEYAQHKADHEALLDELLEVLDRVTDAGGLPRDELAGRLARWFAGHFRTFDARLHAHHA
jgi:hemerythrin-like metal-binding protein